MFAFSISFYSTSGLDLVYFHICPVLRTREYDGLLPYGTKMDCMVIFVDLPLFDKCFNEILIDLDGKRQHKYWGLFTSCISSVFTVYVLHCNRNTIRVEHVFS